MATTISRISVPTNPELTTSLRSQINTSLLSSGAIPTIHASLLHECQATGWLELIKARVLDLLRSGECVSYGEVLSVVMREIKGNGNCDGEGAFDVKNENGNGLTNGDAQTKESLRVPRTVVEVGTRLVRDALDLVVNIEVE